MDNQQNQCGKNIVICCDGTSNQYGGDDSNVVKLYGVLRHDPHRQIAFYDPGVGTFGSYNALTPFYRKFKRILGLAFGLGITRNVMEAYWYLMQNYTDGDKIFLFGFSRGAYTVRVLAALIRKCGILHRDNQNLIPEAVRILKLRSKKSFRIAKGFRRTFAQCSRVHFLGLWDTVTSVGWIWDPVRIHFTTKNSGVKIVRHAVAIDERRAFFRQNLWIQKPKSQDVVQVWFAGAHADVGGAYPSSESGLSQIGLQWMIKEAESKGLLFDNDKVDAALDSPPPDYLMTEHNSLVLKWWPAEIFPKLVWIAVPDEVQGTRWIRRPRFNLGRTRYIDKSAHIHSSVAQRIREKPEYNPENLCVEDEGTNQAHLSSSYTIVD